MITDEQKKGIARMFVKLHPHIERPIDYSFFLRAKWGLWIAPEIFAELLKSKHQPRPGLRTGQEVEMNYNGWNITVFEDPTSWVAIARHDGHEIMVRGYTRAQAIAEAQAIVDRHLRRPDAATLGHWPVNWAS